MHQLRTHSRTIMHQYDKCASRIQMRRNAPAHCNAQMHRCTCQVLRMASCTIAHQISTRYSMGYGASMVQVQQMLVCLYSGYSHHFSRDVGMRRT